MSRFSNLTVITARQITVVASGTPVQGADFAVPPGVSVVVRGHRDNTGTLHVADSSANALNTGSSNFELGPLESISLDVTNTNRIWADSTQAGDIAEVVFER